MPRRAFTDADRQKALDTRKRNAAKRKDFAALWDSTDNPDAVFLGFLLSVVRNDAASTGDRIRAAQTALPYVEQKLRARDAESKGANPINLNEQMMDALTETHGDPWEEGEDVRSGKSPN